MLYIFGFFVSFVIGGLIDRQVTETMAKIPVLSSLPILGNLFKTKEFDRNNTELVVMVTPEVEVVDYGSLPRSERKTKRVFDTRIQDSII